MNILIAHRRAALVLGLAIACGLAACASEPAPGNSGGQAVGGSVAGATTAAAGQGGASAGNGSALGGSGGSGGTFAGSAGAATLVGGAAGMGGTAGAGGLGASGAGGSAAVCPGAAKALHFQDDVGGATTKSTQLLADLGADLPIADSARTIEMWLYMEGKESWKTEHSLIEYGGTGRCQAFGIDGGDNANKDPAQLDPFTFSSGGPCTGDNNMAPMPAVPRTGWLHLAWVYRVILKGNEPGLIAYYHFDDGLGTTVKGRVGEASRRDVRQQRRTPRAQLGRCHGPRPDLRALGQGRNR